MPISAWPDVLEACLGRVFPGEQQMPATQQALELAALRRREVNTIDDLLKTGRNRIWRLLSGVEIGEQFYLRRDRVEVCLDELLDTAGGDRR